ncbi:MAG: class I adenylate-forming enzyme family protein [Acidimicrobiia bacterium]
MPIDGGALDALEHPLDLVLRVGLATKPDELALVSAEDRMTWRELDDASTRLANSYRDLGLERGDRIASLMPNRTLLAVHYLAAFKAGLVVTPLNYRYAAPEIDHALEVSAASALVVHAERADDLAARRLAPRLPRGVITYGAAGASAPTVGALIARTGPQIEMGSPDPSAPAAIFFTSGSTGPAKGVTHSLETLGWMTASAVAGLELTRDDVFLPGSSMSHIGSFLWTFATFAAGGQVVVARTFDAHEILPLLREHRPTVLAMIPAALTALIRDHDVTSTDFESLRLCRAGADKVSLELEAEFIELAGILIDEGYGMTEVGIATLNPPSGVIKKGSIGPPIPGFSISVRDDDGGEVAPGEVGRVWIRTSSHTIGYWENPEATAEIMRDGWLDSGDLVRADDDGYLWFFGRKKQIIVHDGSNISPYEVEGALVEHPDIALCGVVGIHDEVHGENVRAYVTLKEGCAPPSSADLITFARERIGYKAPEEVVILDEMPLNPTGKLDRVRLKRLAEEQLHPHGLD